MPVKRVINRFKKAIEKRNENMRRFVLLMNEQVEKIANLSPDSRIPEYYDEISYMEKLKLIGLLYDIKKLRFHFERLEFYKSRDRQMEQMKKKRFAIFDSSLIDNINEHTNNESMIGTLRSVSKKRWKPLIECLRSTRDSLIKRSSREFDILKLVKEKQLKEVENRKNNIHEKGSKHASKPRIVTSLTLENISAETSNYTPNRSTVKPEDLFKVFIFNISSRDLLLLAESLVEAWRTMR